MSCLPCTGSSTLRSTTSDGSGSGIGATINVGPNATVNIPNGHSAHNNHSSSLSSGSSSLSPHTTLSGGGSGSIALTSSNSNHTQDSTDSGLQELEDFEFPDLSLSVCITQDRSDTAACFCSLFFDIVRKKSTNLTAGNLRKCTATKCSPFLSCLFSTAER